MAASYRRLNDFPPTATRRAGYELDQVQHGLLPSDWKSMSSIGPGVIEIRIHEPHEHRVIYLASQPEGIYVLHAFEKKTQKTPQKDIEIARGAYAEVQRNLKAKNKNK